MSHYLIKDVPVLHNPLTLAPWGMLGYDTKEYALPFGQSATYSPSAVAITGGTINGATIGVTTPAIVKTSDLQAVFTDSSGTPGNATNSSSRGRVAFAAAGTSVVVTSTLCTANSSVFVSLAGGDSTLTSVRVTPAAGSFTITGNAAATAITKCDFHIVN